MYDDTSPHPSVTDTPLPTERPIATRLPDDGPDAARYRAILQGKIDEGARRTAEVILEPIRGEFLVLGAEWSNSDVGNGVHSLRTFALRVACLNGMTRENLLKQVHLGGRLSEEIEFSDRTHRLDTAASASALRDVVRGAFGAAGRDRMLDSITAAHDRTMNKTQLSAATRGLSKTVQKSVLDAFESNDVINLPEGATAWRASNAISWIARNTDDPELRLDLERSAGALV